MLRYILLCYGLTVICLGYPWGPFEMLDGYTLSSESCFLYQDVSSICSCRKLCMEDSRCYSFGAETHSYRWKCGLFDRSATLVPKVSFNGVIGRSIEMICPAPLNIIPNVGCIYLTTVLADWLTSRAYCLGIGADLWSDSNNTNAMSVSSYLQQTITGGGRNQYWTSAKQLANTDQFLWNDGTVAKKNAPNNWLGWYNGEPNSGNAVDYCARLDQEKGYLAGDSGCLGDQYFAICEKKLPF